MTRVDAAWLTLWAGLGATFWLADRRGVALCATTRHLFHTDTMVGRAAFTTAFGAGALVLHRHVLKPVESAARRTS